MECPRCNKKLEEAIFHNTGVDYCPQCLGIFFDEDELRQAKDDRDRGLRWMDIDLWKDKNKFKVSFGIRLCPACRLPLYEVYYSDTRARRSRATGGEEDLSSLTTRVAANSKRASLSFSPSSLKRDSVAEDERSSSTTRVVVDVCNVCHGIWLDRGEFKKIVGYLKKEAEYEILNDYIKTLSQEFWEIFTGPEKLREEVLDFLSVFKIINYKFLVQYPYLSNVILNLPR